MCAERVLGRSPATCCLRSLFLGFKGACQNHMILTLRPIRCTMAAQRKSYLAVGLHCLVEFWMTMSRRSCLKEGTRAAETLGERAGGCGGLDIFSLRPGPVSELPAI